MVSAFVIVCAVAALLWLIGAFFNTFSGVFLPLAVAGIIALILNPYFDWLVAKNLPSPLALVAVFLAILLPIAAFGWFVGDIVVEQVSDLISKIPGWWKAGVEWAQDKAPKLKELYDEYGLEERLKKSVEGKEGDLLSGLGSSA